MDINALKERIALAAPPRITVFGDYCLDKYMYIDPALDEPSLETGLVAYQVTHTKTYPGAAGTIVNNLRSLGAEVTAVGIAGEDGEGYELMARLNDIGADTSLMVRTDRRQTCTYIKPMRGKPGQERELSRLDMRNFTDTPAEIEDALIENLRKAAENSSAVIICDQFVELNKAAVTDRVREAIGDMASKRRDMIWYADSRGHTDKFKNVIVKCNHREIAGIFGRDPSEVDKPVAMELAALMHLRNGMPAVVTLGEKGCVTYDGEAGYAPAFPAEGPVDICGAGDACSAGMVFALTLGASLKEAAVVGNACSGIVIRQIGVTGTASVEGVLEKLDEYPMLIK